MKFSIVVPSLNQASFLKRTLDSLVAQSRDVSLEVIVQDAGSDDGSRDILDQYADHPNISVFIESDSGQSDAINRGLGRATGDIFGWLNSDDVLVPGALEHVAQTFAANPDCNLVYGEALFVDESDLVVAPYPTGDLKMDSMRHRCVISQPSTFVRRLSLLEIGGVNEELKYCMDYDLWTEYLLRGHQVYRIPRVLSHTRLHDETKTNLGGLAFIEEIIRMQECRLGEASSIWQMYRLSRTDPIAGIKPRLLRFVAAAAWVAIRRPVFLVEAFQSIFERSRSTFQARKLVV